VTSGSRCDSVGMGSRAVRGGTRGPRGVVGGGALRLRGAGVSVIVVVVVVVVVLLIVRLLGAVVEHGDLGLVGDGDGAGALRPRLPVHLHGHPGALQHQLMFHQMFIVRIIVFQIMVEFISFEMLHPFRSLIHSILGLSTLLTLTIHLEN